METRLNLCNNGFFFVCRDFKLMQCVMQDSDLSSLIASTNIAATFQHAILTDNNLPCVKFSDGSSFIYHNDLQTW